MKLLILLFASFLIFVSPSMMKQIKLRSVPIDFFDGFKHIPAYEIAMKFLLLENEFSSYIYSCRFSYCHNENRNNCNNSCINLALKMDKTFIANLHEELTEPMTDIDDCKNKCSLVCGKNNCSRECANLCSIHFSYENCMEYMAEYEDLVIRFNKLVS